MRSDQRQSSRRGYNSEKERKEKTLQEITRIKESGSLHETFEGESGMYNGRGLVVFLGTFVRIINATNSVSLLFFFLFVFASRDTRYSFDSRV